jgi:PhnB protein
MTSSLNPYINFQGNARQAMDFYTTVLGGKLTVNNFGDFGGDASMADKVMHADLTTPSGFRLMASDTPPGMPYTPGTNITISLSGTDEAELRGYWDKLSDGGSITMPLEKAPWGDSFGMCTDRFGVSWLVNISGKPES